MIKNLGIMCNNIAKNNKKKIVIQFSENRIYKNVLRKENLI
tara:strand:- start:1110 stop:1232 length:123 start_codon:yes stop_codon:yes gene_type:complete